MILKYLTKILIFFIILIFSKFSEASCTGLNCTCSITTSPINFSSYYFYTPTSLTSTGNVTITCSASVVGALFSYQIQLSQGNSLNYTQRKLMKGSEILNYNLYTNSNFLTIWGNNSAGTDTIIDGYTLTVLLPRSTNYTVYANIPSNQNVSAGTYSDTITATLFF